LVLDKERVVSEPKGVLMGRIEIHTKTQFVLCRDLQKRLAELQISHREFEISCKDAGIMVYHNKKRMSSGWKAGSNTAPVWAYGFQIDQTKLLEELNVTSGQ
jgi:hypothetical protein